MDEKDTLKPQDSDLPLEKKQTKWDHGGRQSGLQQYLWYSIFNIKDMKQMWEDINTC